MDFLSYNPTSPLGNSEINLNIIPGTPGSYVPLFCLRKLPVDSVVLNNFFSTSSSLRQRTPTPINNFFPEGSSLPTYKRFILRGIHPHLANMTGAERVNLKAIRQMLREYVEDTNFNISRKVYQGGATRSYEGMFKHIQNVNYWSLGDLRNTNYLMNFGFLAIYKEITMTSADGTVGHSVDFNPLFSFVVKAENMKYLRLCYLTGKPIDTSLLEFWMLEDLEDKESDYKLIRMQYRKNLKNYIDEKNIKVVYHKNLVDSLFTQIKSPVLKTLKARSEWVEKAKQEWIQHLVVSNKLERQHNVILDYER